LVFYSGHVSSWYFIYVLTSELFLRGNRFRLTNMFSF